LSQCRFAVIRLLALSSSDVASPLFDDLCLAQRMEVRDRLILKPEREKVSNLILAFVYRTFHVGSDFVILVVPLLFNRKHHP